MSSTQYFKMPAASPVKSTVQSFSQTAGISQIPFYTGAYSTGNTRTTITGAAPSARATYGVPTSISSAPVTAAPVKTAAPVTTAAPVKTISTATPTYSAPVYATSVSAPAASMVAKTPTVVASVAAPVATTAFPTAITGLPTSRSIGVTGVTSSANLLAAGRIISERVISPDEYLSSGYIRTEGMAPISNRAPVPAYTVAPAAPIAYTAPSVVMVEEVATVIPAASVIEVEPIVAPAVEYVTPAVEYVAPAPAPVTEVIETVPVAVVEPVVTEVVTEVVTPAGVVEYATPVVEYTAPAAVPEVVEVVPAVMEYGTAKPAMEYAMPMEVQEPALVVQEQVVQDPMMMQEPVAQEAPSINVLILCTSSDLMSEAAPDKVTGAWLEEIAAPYYMFANAGCQVYLGTLTGTRIPLDEQSLQGDFFTETCARFKEEGGFQLLEEPQALYSITDQGEELLLGPESIDCVFLAGGHGTYTDFLQLAQWITDANFNGKTIGAVCHGVIGLLQAVAVTADGQQVSLLQGRQCTGFSNEEEDAVGLSSKVPFLVQDQMIEAGGDYKCSAPWSDFAIRDGNIITGQNPQSSAQTAELCIQSLQDMLAAQQAQ